jgi:hypothetical protein
MRSREMWRGAWHGPRDSRAVLPVALATGRAPAAAGARLLALSPCFAGRAARPALLFPTMVAAGAGGLDAERIYCWRWFDRNYSLDVVRGAGTIEALPTERIEQ